MVFAHFDFERIRSPMSIQTATTLGIFAHFEHLCLLLSALLSSSTFFMHFLLLPCPFSSSSKTAKTLGTFVVFYIPALPCSHRDLQLNKNIVFYQQNLASRLQTLGFSYFLRGPPEGPKRLPGALKEAPNSPSTKRPPKKAPRGPQATPERPQRGFQEAPKRPQQGPNRPPRGFKRPITMITMSS